MDPKALGKQKTITSSRFLIHPAFGSMAENQRRRNGDKFRQSSTSSLEEAARMSGTGALKTLLRIVVPASVPMILVASLTSQLEATMAAMVATQTA
jgi:hypothetical protein